MEKIPEFTNSDEEIEFWREHDVMEFAGLIDFSDFLRLGGNKSIMVALRMEPVVREQAKKIAKDRGKSYQTLMREWIYAGLRKALKEKHEGKSEVEKLREAVLEIKEDLDELKASIDPAKFKKTSNARKPKKR